jgi:hypothetical protein
MPRCQSCGQHASTLLPCTWDTRLEVGECCEFHLDDLIETPEEAVCEEETRIFCEGKTVREVVAGICKHRMSCPTCSAFPMPRDLWAGEPRPLKLRSARRRDTSGTSDDPARQFKRAA